jgi:methionine sulfoxide reductase heme-binding subunit
MTGHLLSAPVMVGPSLLWYSTRATGVVALVLLTATVMLGVVGSARAASQRWPRIVTATLHRNLALTATALVGVHVVTTVLDPFAPIGWIAAIVPFSSTYRPLWLSLGTIAFDLLLAVMITSILRDRLNHRIWQAVHLLVYASWPVALWHGLGIGTDTKLVWVLGIDVLCVAAVCWAIWWRLTLAAEPQIRTAGIAAIAVLPVLTLVFVLLGPLQPGWSRRAGTPAKLIGAAAPVPAGTGGRTGPGQPGRLTDARFTGQVSTADGPGSDQRTITITGRTDASPRENFTIVLRGTPSGGGVALSGGHVQIGQAGTASGYAGPVVQLQGQQLIAAVTGQGGQRQAEFILTINGSAVTGTVSLLAAAQE